MMQTKIKTIEYNEDKFKELIIYVSNKCEHDQDFGAVKLNKILFYSDFLAYAHLGEPITGAEYFALEHGPAPKMLAPVRDELVNQKDIVIRQRERYGNKQIRVIPLREADLSYFTPEQVSLVDRVIEAFCGANGTDVSRLSHMERGWQVAENKETIPYQAAFLSCEGVTPADNKRAKELALIYNW
jgi:hypothetical protein